MPLPRSTCALLVLCAACSTSTEPAAVTRVSHPERYVLQSVAGKTLPAVAAENASAVFHVLADTLHLEPDGSGVQISRVRVTAAGAAAGEEQRWETRFTYALRGDRFSAAFACPPEPISSCLAPPHLRGARDGGGLRLDLAVTYQSRTPLVYARIAP